MNNEIVVSSTGNLKLNGKTYRCAIGKNGISANHVEGDYCTPTVPMRFVDVYYRADKVARPEVDLPIHEISDKDGWCDDQECLSYNTYVNLPHPGSYELLKREDDVYDIIVTTDYNTNPVVKGKGSAIFFHVARENYSGTAGCVALKLDELLEILSQVNSGTIISVVV